METPPHARLDRRLLLVAGVDLARRVFAYDHDVEPGGPSVRALEDFDGDAGFGSNRLGKLLSI